ncbi:MAG: pyridoxal 5'-phosphate synthase glutaminase subunit PdxT [bacterium]|nr:pyridoxal 5'-phosphate synthase glutaminase subunit PdxT [bacterium]
MVGVLALQGASAAHLAAFASLGVDAREVRSREQLTGLTHLVMPGGESTTIHHLLELFDLRREIVRRHRAGELAIFGTCSGAILLGGDDGEPPPRLGLLDAVLERNAYGRQVDSFTRVVRLEALDAELRCVFIRAPKVREVGPGARVLARDGDEAILISGPGLLAATFHPELTDDSLLHTYFLRPELWNAVAPVFSVG